MKNIFQPPSLFTYYYVIDKNVLLWLNGAMYRMSISGSAAEAKTKRSEKLPAPSVLLKVPDSMKQEFEALKEYDTAYSSPLKDLVFYGVPALGIIDGGATFGVSLLSDIWGLWFLPTVVGVGALFFAEKLCRKKYRKNLRHAKLVKQTVLALKNTLKDAYGLKVDTNISQYDYATVSTPRRMKSFAENILLGLDIRYSNDFYATNLETHKQERVTLTYDAASERFSLTHTYEGAPIAPKTENNVIELTASKKTGQKELAAEPVKEAVLPKLSTADFDFNSYPKKMRKAVGIAVQTYGKLADMNLSVEDSYKAERAALDLQGAVNLFDTIKDLGGPNAEETAVTIINKLNTELNTISQAKLKNAMGQLEQHRIYVTERES